MWRGSAGISRQCGHACTVQAQQFAKLQSAVQRLVRKQLASAFCGWQFEAARFAQLRCAVQRLVQRQLAMAFSGWREAASQQRRLVAATGEYEGWVHME